MRQGKCIIALAALGVLALAGCAHHDAASSAAAQGQPTPQQMQQLAADQAQAAQTQAASRQQSQAHLPPGPPH